MNLVEIIRRDSNSLLSLGFSLGFFLNNLTKVLLVCLSFSFCFPYLPCFFQIILYIVSVLNDKTQAASADIGTNNKRKPAEAKVIKVVVGTKLSIVSTVSDFVVRALLFLFLFLIKKFCL